MASLTRNPVSYSIYAFAVLFVVISFGESPILVMQHIVVPYSVDVSHGIGARAAPVFRAVALALQCLVALFVYQVSASQSPGNRRFLSVLGIFFVAVYFFVVALGYVTPRLH